MRQLNELDTIRYVGPFDRELALATGEVGVVLEDYGDGNYESEFSLPDGTTWPQCALPNSSLELIPKDAQLETPVASSIYSTIQAFERGECKLIDCPPTGEKLSVHRIDDGRLAVTTPSVGAVASPTRPK